MRQPGGVQHFPVRRLSARRKGEPAYQPAVRVTVDGSPDPVPGTLARLGVDLLMVSCPDGSTVHIPLTAVVEVHLTDT